MQVINFAAYITNMILFNTQSLAPVSNVTNTYFFPSYSNCRLQVSSNDVAIAQLQIFFWEYNF